MAADHGLGDIVSRHEVDNSRSRSVALTGLVVGLVAIAIAIPLMVTAFDYEAGDQTSRGLVPGLVMGVGVVGLLLAATNGVRYRRKEEYELREGGIVLRRNGRAEAVPWSSIRAIRDDSRSYGQSFGWNVYVRVQVQDGPRLLITGFVEDAEKLVAAIADALVKRAES